MSVVTTSLYVMNLAVIGYLFEIAGLLPVAALTVYMYSRGSL